MNYIEQTAALASRRPCGKSNCYVSTSIDEITLTFGSGELDDYGFWEKPCIVCALEHKKKNPQDNVWPRKEGIHLNPRKEGLK